MSTFSQVADALTSALATISGLRAFAYPHPDPPVPCAVVVPGANELDQTYGDLIEQTWTVRVLVGRGDDRDAAERLYEFLDPTGASSIKAVIEASAAVAAVCDDVAVTGFAEPAVFTYGAGLLLGVDFTVIVHL